MGGALEREGSEGFMLPQPPQETKDLMLKTAIRNRIEQMVKGGMVNDSGAAATARPIKELKLVSFKKTEIDEQVVDPEPQRWGSITNALPPADVEDDGQVRGKPMKELKLVSFKKTDNADELDEMVQRWASEDKKDEDAPTTSKPKRQWMSIADMKMMSFAEREGHADDAEAEPIAQRWKSVADALEEEQIKEGDQQLPPASKPKWKSLADLNLMSFAEREGRADDAEAEPITQRWKSLSDVLKDLASDEEDDE